MLFGIGEENRRTILAANIRALPVELRRVMGDDKEDLQQLRIRDLRRIEAHAHGFGMTCPSAANRFVIGLAGAAASVARLDAGHALDVLEHRIDAPETAASENGGLQSRHGALRLALGQRRNGMGGYQDSENQPCNQRQDAELR